VIVTSEAARAQGEDTCYKTTALGKKRLGGIGEYIAEQCERQTGIEARACALGHILRGGPPTAADQILASTLAVEAVDYLANGESGFVLMREGNKTVKCPYGQLKDERRKLSLDHELFKTATGLGITFSS
jgi:6-phosphofructokinase 1